MSLIGTASEIWLKKRVMSYDLSIPGDSVSGVSCPSSFIGASESVAESSVVSETVSDSVAGAFSAGTSSGTPFSSFTVEADTVGFSTIGSVSGTSRAGSATLGSSAFGGSGLDSSSTSGLGSSFTSGTTSFGFSVTGASFLTSSTAGFTSVLVSLISLVSAAGAACGLSFPAAALTFFNRRAGGVAGFETGVAMGFTGDMGTEAVVGGTAGRFGVTFDKTGVEDEDEVENEAVFEWPLLNWTGSPFLFLMLKPAGLPTGV
ncbi:hypothetical protein OGAPHI_002367 [Ogataea philodendri]|uniref:Uncharacterized protein n=1 Tax=Ogataea philodendri TaxID=1378263 RepID=A0A9P8T6Z5_9ASCO|nr:uncharacterized protein OGAPHI_002367 [Ogataea philodendri]KAH3668613.1 hypothetical protein OGAPHI_002367 [Ogataea philodendri]